tara:strand:- start:480 stop:665 length:186 start_codon:yes stop_codon:yes gene_type:complete
MLSKKYYVKFAELLKQLKENKRIYNWTIEDYEIQLTNELVSMFKVDNRNFNIVKFREYINK